MPVTLELDDIQGLFARGYRGLPTACFTLFNADTQDSARALLAWVLPRVTTAGEFSGDSALHVGLTPSGLRRLGLSETALARFSAEFVGGMTEPNRSRFLGDVEENGPHSWRWGGPRTPPIDGVLLLYATDEAVLTSRQSELRRQFDEVGVHAVEVLDTLEVTGAEPFGFRDGISQPIVDGLPKAVPGERTVAAGEFVLGYPNAYGLLTDRPLLPAADDPGRVLPPDPGGSGAADLGRDGSYLVLRQLQQHVDTFWQYVQEATRRPDGSADPEAKAVLAAKMVGRWPSGTPVAKAPHRDVAASEPDNDFGYHHIDPLGLACPLGAHVRRMNPRDSLDPRPGTDASLDVNDRHRLLRRARNYRTNGRGSPDGASDGEYAETGLHFMCLAGNLARQFEFVQHTWLNNPKFNGLYDDSDPVSGSRHSSGGTFTVPARPVRRRYRDLPEFVRTRGGAYFFLPGLAALRYLQQLPGTSSSPAQTR